MATAVTPENILKELTELWVSLGEGDENGVLRACAMTLIVAADEEEEASVLGEMIAEVMHDHPSRAIVLRVRDGGAEVLESRVLAQCWKPFGRSQQICCEQIEIMTSEGSLVDAPRILLGLTAPDLPVVLICRTPSLFALPAFAPLLDIAGKVIVDSRSAKRPAAVLQEIYRRRFEHRDVHDLAWTSITGWRETIARAFDNRETLSALRNLHHVRVVHGDCGPTTEVYYLGAWLERGLGITAGVEFRAAQCGETIHTVELWGEGLHLGFTRGAGNVVHYVKNGVVTSLPFRVSSDWDLLRDELSLLGRDRMYEDALPRAIALAGS